MQYQQVAREDSDEKQQAHRRREQHQVEDIGRGSYDGRDDEDTENGIPAVIQKKHRTDNSQQGQEEDQDGKFEDEAHAHHYVEKQLKVVTHGDHGLHAVSLPDTQQERETVAEDDEIREKTPRDEEARGNQDERRRPTSFAAVQAGGDEGPDLVKNNRRP